MPRQASLIGLSLLFVQLLAANAWAADHYHARAATYACVDRKALFSNNPVTRVRGRCFRIKPGQRLESLSLARRGVMLLRIEPPIPGEPPLYFRTSSLTRRPEPAIGSSHRRRRLNGDALSLAGIPAVETLTQSIASAPPPPPASTLAVVAPEISSPASHPAMMPASPAGAAGASPESAIPGLPDAAVPASPPASVPAPVPADASVPQVVSPVPAATQAVHPAATSASSTPPAAIQSAPAEQHPSRGALFWPLLLWLVIIGAAMLLVRLVLVRASRREREAERENLEAQVTALWKPAAPPPGPAPLPRHADEAVAAPAPVAMHQVAEHAVEVTNAAGSPNVGAISMSDYKARCVARLRHAGWDARTRFSAGLPGPDVIARNNGLVLALQCHPWSNPVDIEAVEDACMIRERQHSDLAAIVSSSSFTDAARQLAASTGIVLLHEDELASFAA